MIRESYYYLISVFKVDALTMQHCSKGAKIVISS